VFIIVQRKLIPRFKTILIARLTTTAELMTILPEEARLSIAERALAGVKELTSGFLGWDSQLQFGTRLHVQEGLRRIKQPLLFEFDLEDVLVSVSGNHHGVSERHL